MTLKIEHETYLNTNTYLELRNKKQVLHLELSKEQHVMGRDRTLTDLLVPEDWQVVGRCQAVLRKEGDEYCIYDGDGHKPSTNGLYVNHTRITPETGFPLRNGTEINIGQNPENLVVLKYCNPSKPVVNATLTLSSISVKNRSVLIGRDANATLALEAPTVSRRHATIDTDAQGRYILRDYSTNGVFVNGQRINGTAILSPSTTIRIGSYTLVLRGDELQVLDQGNQIRLDTCNADLVYRAIRFSSCLPTVCLCRDAKFRVSTPVKPPLTLLERGNCQIFYSVFLVAKCARALLCKKNQ